MPRRTLCVVAKSLDGLHPTLMRPRVEALLADPEAKAMGVTVVSAFRSNERQKQLFDDAVRRYGSVAKARKWVAPPGKSNHGPRVDGYGTAVDFGVRGVKAVSGQWPEAIVRRFDAIAARHGLFSPMEWEDWHFEPIKNWAGTSPASVSEEDDVALTKEQAEALDDLVPNINHHISAKGGNIDKLLTETRKTNRLLGEIAAALKSK